jgi:hypothetical protein
MLTDILTVLVLWKIGIFGMGQGIRDLKLIQEKYHQLNFKQKYQY